MKMRLEEIGLEVEKGKSWAFYHCGAQLLFLFINKKIKNSVKSQFL